MSVERVRRAMFRGPTHVTLPAIVIACADSFGVEVKDVASASRRRPIARARNAVCILARELTSQSNAQIGRAIGRDHATVTYATKRARQLLAEDGNPFSTRVEQARQVIMEAIA
jgi:chromosomal replication initiation ATPase DnaA